MFYLIVDKDRHTFSKPTYGTSPTVVAFREITGLRAYETIHRYDLNMKRISRLEAKQYASTRNDLKVPHYNDEGFFVIYRSKINAGFDLIIPIE